MINIIKLTKSSIIIGAVIFSVGCAETPIFKNIPILGGVERFLAETVAPSTEVKDTDLDERSDETVKLPIQAGDIVAVNNQNSEKIYDAKV